MFKDHLMREALKKSTKILAGKNVPVRMEGFAPRVEFKPNGDVAEIVIPMVPDDCPHDLLEAVKGLLDHESAHVLYSSHKDIVDTSKDRVWHLMHNFIDDNHINMKSSIDYRGTYIELKNAYKYIFNNIEAYKEQNIKAHMKADKKSAIATYMPAYISKKMKSPFVEEFYDSSSLVDLYKDIDAAMGSDLRRDFEKCDTPEKVANLTDRAVLFFKEYYDELDKVAQQNQSACEFKKGSKPKSEDKPEKKKKPKPEKSEKDEGEKEKSDDGKDKDEGNSGKDETPKDKPESKDKEESDKKPEQEEKESGGSEGEDDEPEDQEEDEGKGSGKPEKNSGEDSESDPENEDEDDSEGGDGTAPDTTAEDREREIKPSDLSFDDALASIVEKKISMEYEMKKGSFFWSDRMNEIFPYKDYKSREGHYGHSKHDNLEKFDAECKATGAYLRKLLERMLAAKNRIFYTCGYKSGKLTSKQLAFVPTGKTDVFSRKNDAKAKNSAVTILMDLSGSMGGEKVNLAAKSTYALADCLERLKVPYEIAGFWTDSPATSLVNRSSLLNAWKKFSDKAGSVINKVVNPTNINSYVVFKDFNEPFGLNSKQGLMDCANSKVGMASNEDATHVRIALERLAARPEERKVLFVLSDGSPAFGSSANNCASKLKELAADAESAYGVNVVGIGIMTDIVKRFYPRHVVVKNLDELPNTLFQLLYDRVFS